MDIYEYICFRVHRATAEGKHRLVIGDSAHCKYILSHKKDFKNVGINAHKSMFSSTVTLSW